MLRLGEDIFRARVRDGRITLARGDADDADATIRTDLATLSAVLWHGHRLADALCSGDLEIQGSTPAATRFLTLFAPPEPAVEAQQTPSNS